MLNQTDDLGRICVILTLHRYPELITHVFSVCTPYTAPHKEYSSLEELVRGRLPQFGYQLHLCSPEVEAAVTSKESIKQFLNGLYGGKGTNGEVAFDPAKGILIENLPKIGKSKLFNDKVSSVDDGDDRSIVFIILYQVYALDLARRESFELLGLRSSPGRPAFFRRSSGH